MLNSSKAIAFVATTNPAGAREFYEKKLGLSLISEDAFALVFDANGTMLRVQKVQELSPAQYTALGWEVADISVEVEELGKKGVVFSRYEWLQQDDRGIWTSPGGAKIAWFKDPDGNTLSLTQFR
jgi:catechol 2,3-dioxygenase-like lactoylglutathione lyase family enzyme